MPQTGYSVTNTFAGQSGNVPASQLDTDFSQPATALNALVTFGNYFVDSGAANALAITVSSPLVATLAAGLPFQVKIATLNTGATTLAVNGGATTNLVYPSSAAAMLPGQLKVGAIVSLMYDGTNFQYLGDIFGNSSFVGSLSGCTGSVSPTINWSLTGYSVYMWTSAGGTGTSNATTMALGNVPSYLQTAASVNYTPVTFGVTDSGVTQCGIMFPTNSSSFSLKLLTVSGATLVQNTFTGTGTKGINANWSASYSLV